MNEMICFKEFSTNYFYFFVPFFYVIDNQNYHRFPKSSGQLSIYY